MFTRSISAIIPGFAILALHSPQVLRAEEESGPRAGKYSILSYGAVGRPPLVLGSFVLSDGNKYKAFLVGDKPTGEGSYAYDTAKKTVIWQSGPYLEDKWGGAFTIDREGKTHKIRLKRTTTGTNSIDSGK